MHSKNRTRPSPGSFLVTGCRIGEALGLKWGAINFDDKLVWFLTASYAGEEHLTKGHRSKKPLYLTEAEISRLKQLKSLSPNAQKTTWCLRIPNTRTGR